MSSPPMRLRSVVLPEPLGPMSATNSPAAMSRLRLSQHGHVLLAAGVVLDDIAQAHDGLAHALAPFRTAAAAVSCSM